MPNGTWERPLRALIGQGLVRSAQDVADGGLAIALAECALLGGTGATLQSSGNAEVMLFSEDQGRAVVTCKPGRTVADPVGRRPRRRGVKKQVRPSGSRLDIAGVLSVDLAALRAAWEGHA